MFLEPGQSGFLGSFDPQFSKPIPDRPFIHATDAEMHNGRRNERGGPENAAGIFGDGIHVLEQIRIG